MTVQIVTINFTPLHQQRTWIPLSCLDSYYSLVFNIILGQFITLINHISQITRMEGASFDTWVEVISFFLAV